VLLEHCIQDESGLGRNNSRLNQEIMQHFELKPGRRLSLFGSNLTNVLQIPEAVLAMGCHLSCTDQQTHPLGHE
jgi:hypothetical protein